MKFADGILATPREKVGKSLKPQAKKAVLDFYENDIFNKCQARIIMSVFHWKPISKRASFYVISKNSTKNLELKIQPLELGFLNLPAYAQNDVALGASGTRSVCVCSIQQNAILLCSASGLKVTYKDVIN